MIGLLHKKREDQIKKHLKFIEKRRAKARRKGMERTKLKHEKKVAQKRKKHYISDRKMRSILSRINALTEAHNKKITAMLGLIE